MHLLMLLTMVSAARSIDDDCYILSNSAFTAGVGGENNGCFQQKSFEASGGCFQFVEAYKHYSVKQLLAKHLIGIVWERVKIFISTFV